jgi:hypothetical protein
MQIPLLILMGIAIWALSVAAARRFGAADGSAVADVTLGFITVWFLALATSFWVSVAKGQHTFRQLLPVYLLIFGLPASLAALGQSRLARKPAESSRDDLHAAAAPDDDEERT